MITIRLHQLDVKGGSLVCRLECGRPILGEYPILRFDEVPELEVELIEAPDYGPLGVGEAAHRPTAAVANAVTQALDFRIRDLPITRERIISATSRMS